MLTLQFRSSSAYNESQPNPILKQTKPFPGTMLYCAFAGIAMIRTESCD